MSETERQYDIVVWGATGFAGRLVAAYLTEQYSPESLSIALGGRNENRLAAVASDLTSGSETWEDIPTVIGDATAPKTLHEIAQSTSVVCTTVGPYTTYGTPLVEACVEAETDYCDLTGEANWIREIIDSYHKAAVDAETRIVHSCGFDSVPADLGTMVAQNFAIEEFGSPCDTVRIYLDDASGGVSGGTLASMAEVFAAAADDPAARETLRNPYSLAPAGERDGVDPGAQNGPRKDPLRGGWTGPSPMALVNERVVRRSNALLDYPWGRGFRCSEVVPTGSGVTGAAGATLLAGGIGLFTAAMSVAPVRAALQRYVFPESGEGPSQEQIENGYFSVCVVGQGTTEDGPFTVEAEFGTQLDPGYGATARMLGESAVCLVRDDVDSPLNGGILTPASGIGMPLVERLRDVEFTITVGEAGAAPATDHAETQ